MLELPSWAKAKVAQNNGFQTSAEETSEKEETTVAKGRWAQRLNETDTKENLKRKGNETQKRRYTIEGEEISGKRQRTEAFSSHESDPSFADVFLTAASEDFGTESSLEKQEEVKAVVSSAATTGIQQAEPEKLVYVEGEKGELHSKVLSTGEQPQQPQPQQPEEESSEEVVPASAQVTPTKADDDGFQSSVTFLENLTKPLANEDLVKASARKTLTKGYLKRAFSQAQDKGTPTRVTRSTAAPKRQTAKDKDNKDKLLEKQIATANEVNKTRELLLKMVPHYIFVFFFFASTLTPY